MRTPGQDRELAVGFLYTEGILHDRNAIEEIAQGTVSSITVVTSALPSDTPAICFKIFTTSRPLSAGRIAIQTVTSICRVSIVRPAEEKEYLEIFLGQLQRRPGRALLRQSRRENLQLNVDRSQAIVEPSN
jgi:FdhD protein